MTDVERILRAIKRSTEAPARKASRWEKIFRDIWAIIGPSWLPYDFPGTFGEYVAWVINNEAEVLSDPQGALKTRTLRLLVDIGEVFGFEITVRTE